MQRTSFLSSSRASLATSREAVSASSICATEQRACQRDDPLTFLNTKKADAHLVVIVGKHALFILLVLLPFFRGSFLAGDLNRRQVLTELVAEDVVVSARAGAASSATCESSFDNLASSKLLAGNTADTGGTEVLV